MEHSLMEYLQRQSTPMLEGLLRVYLQDPDSYGYVIPQILEILTERKGKLQ